MSKRKTMNAAAPMLLKQHRRVAVSISTKTTSKMEAKASEAARDGTLPSVPRIGHRYLVSVPAVLATLAAEGPDPEGSA
jgi:hypothetical protein